MSEDTFKLLESDEAVQQYSDKNRDFKCPECGGEFNEWDETGYATTVVAPTLICPFCGKEKGSYNEDPAVIDKDNLFPDQNLQVTADENLKLTIDKDELEKMVKDLLNNEEDQ